MSQLAVAQAQKQIPSPMVMANGILQQKCDKCKKKKTLLQRASIQDAPDTALPIVYEVLRSQGQPLDPSTRKFMEARFGKDFSHVLIYTDSKAAESANAINAIAYTMGRNIVFGPGKYAPHINAGQKLIAHELTHVIQQFNHLENIDIKSDIIRPQDAYEHEADMAAMDAMAGRTVHISPIPSASIQRVAGADDEHCQRRRQPEGHRLGQGHAVMASQGRHDAAFAMRSVAVFKGAGHAFRLSSATRRC